MVAIKVAETVRLVSRNGLDHTRRFPELAAALRALEGSLSSTASWRCTTRSLSPGSSGSGCLAA
jgi:hypothetical protein